MTEPNPANPFATTFQVYRDLGWQGTIPVDFLDKQPPPEGFTGFDGKWPTDGKLTRWADLGPRNIALRLPDDVIGVDVDNYAKRNKRGELVHKHGAAQLQAFEERHGKLPPTWSSTKRDPDGASRIHFYRVPAGTQFPESIADDIDIIQFGHRYAVVWPSVMPDDEEPEITLIYAWFDTSGSESQVPPGPGDLTTLPSHLVAAIQSAGPVKSVESGRSKSGKGLGVYLPPADPGRTNEWLTARAGELAIVFRHDLDRYLEYVKLIDSSSTDPHDLAELEKTARSVWRREQGKQVPGAGTIATGGLYSQSGRIMSGVVSADEEGGDYEFANFDMRVLGRVRDSEGEVDGYEIDLHDDRRKRNLTVYLPTNVLYSGQRLAGWLGRYEVAIVAAKFPKALEGHTRLALYLSAQPAPDVRIVPFWGWDDVVQGFVTGGGIIRATGIEATSAVRPDPELVRRNLIHHRYGFEFDQGRARAILNEVLTFQDATVASVVGAWWMATKLKGQIMRLSSMFPVMVIEATAGSGKSRGFFEFLYALDGNTREQSVPTAAAFIRKVGSHRNGYVWMDDPEDVTPKHRTAIRSATGEKESEKSANDNQSNDAIQLVAPVMLSGEGFGLDSEKAMADRVIQISLPPSKDRRSLHDPNRLQWDDVIDFKRTHPDLTMAAGTLVSMALQFEDLVDQLPELRVGGARHGDKMAILRVGARVLAAVTGDPAHIDIVDTWCGVQVDRGNENALTLQVIPAAFRTVVAEHDPVKIDRPPYHGIPTPVVVRPDKNGEVRVWVNFDHLADWWVKHNRSAEVRTTTAKAFMDQARAIGMRGQTGEHGIDWYKMTVKDERGSKTGSRPSYQCLPPEIAARLLADYGALSAPRQGPDERLTRLAERSKAMRPTSPSNRP